MKTARVVQIMIILCLFGCTKEQGHSDVGIKQAQQTKPSTNHLATTVDQEKTVGLNIQNYTQVEWVDLIPDDDLHALKNPPAYIDELEDGGIDDNLPSQLKASPSAIDDRYQQALTSTKIRPEFNNRKIRIPGFIVPLEFDEHQVITSFFLVPFFGACLHMPPPPPNQIIYAEYEPGLRLDALYDPYWIQGTLSTTLIENDLATAAYTINVVAIEAYVEIGIDDEYIGD